MRGAKAFLVCMAAACSGSGGDGGNLDPTEAFEAAVGAIANATSDAAFGAAKRPADTRTSKCPPPNGSGLVTLTGTFETIEGTETFRGAASVTSCAGSGFVASGTANVYQSEKTPTGAFILFVPAQFTVNADSFQAAQLSVTIVGSKACYSAMNLRRNSGEPMVLTGGGDCGM